MSLRCAFRYARSSARYKQSITVTYQFRYGFQFYHTVKSVCFAKRAWPGFHCNSSRENDPLSIFRKYINNKRDPDLSESCGSRDSTFFPLHRVYYSIYLFSIHGWQDTRGKIEFITKYFCQIVLLIILLNLQNCLRFGKSINFIFSKNSRDTVYNLRNRYTLHK